MILPKRILIIGLGSIGSYYVGLIKKTWPSIDISILRSGKGKFYKEIALASEVFNDHTEALKWKPDTSKKTSVGRRNISKSMMNKHKRRQYKKYRGQGNAR